MTITAIRKAEAIPTTANLDDPSEPRRKQDNEGVDEHVPAAAVGRPDPDECEADEHEPGHLFRPVEGIVERIPDE